MHRADIYALRAEAAAGHVNLNFLFFRQVFDSPGGANSDALAAAGARVDLRHVAIEGPAGAIGRHAAREALGPQDILDLQVCFLLAWTGYHLRQRSSLVSALLERGGLYHEEQKQQLLQVCHEEIARIIDFHRELEAAGLIEITVTPYAHPILPLLCNLQSAWDPSPGLPLPAADFRHPEDARLQVREGLRTAERFFGKRRRGMWPAEGGVSHEAVLLMQEERSPAFIRETLGSFLAQSEDELRDGDRQGKRSKGRRDSPRRRPRQTSE